MLLLFISNACISTILPTKLNDYNLKCYGVEDGLAQNSVTDIAILDDGQLLIASYSGVVVFDRLRFSNYIPGTTKQFPAMEAFALGVEESGVIWVGATSSGLYRIEKENIQYWGIEEGLAALLIRKIHVGEKGLFINNDNKVLFLENDSSNQFKIVEKEDSLFFDAFKHIENQLIHDGDISYLAKDSQVYKVENGKSKQYISEFIKDTQVTISKLLLDRNKDLWVATASNGLYRWSVHGLES